jgi:hypothetical protein
MVREIGEANQEDKEKPPGSRQRLDLAVSGGFRAARQIRGTLSDRSVTQLMVVSASRPRGRGFRAKCWAKPFIFQGDRFITMMYAKKTRKRGNRISPLLNIRLLFASFRIPRMHQGKPQRTVSAFFSASRELSEA